MYFQNEYYGYLFTALERNDDIFDKNFISGPAERAGGTLKILSVFVKLNGKTKQCFKTESKI